MIKIENSDIEQISKTYFESIKVVLLERSQYYLDVLNVLFNNTNFLTIATGGPHGTTKKSLINLFLITNQKLNDQNHFQDVTQENCNSWVIANHDILRDIANYINNEINLKELILCKPDDAIAIENKVKASIGINIANYTPHIISFIKNIISYPLFDDFAYRIASDLNVNTCPYCNRNYINTVITKNNQCIIRPTFDHFFPQSKHPFLSLSFYNLIPSCYYCNSSLKSAATIDINTHIHPYKEGFDLDTTFRILVKGCKPNKSDPDNYTLLFYDNMDATLLNDRYRKIFGGTRIVKNLNEGNLNLFRLADIYQSHLDIVGELIVKCDSLSSGYSDSLHKILGLLNTNKSEFYQFHFGNYFNESDFNRRPMAKLTKDVVSQVLPNFIR